MSVRSIVKTLTPAPIREGLLVYRRLPLWRAAGAIFIHVPKNAGSSVNEALYGRFMGHVPARRLKALAPGAFATLPTFALLRDPVERCRSAYAFAKAGRGEGDGVIAGIAQPERYRIPAFESFERFVAEWLPAQDLDRADPVFRTQASYVCDGAGRVLVDHLGHVGAMGETEAWLAERLGRRVAIGHTNRTRAASATLIDPATRDRIEALYHRDVALLVAVGRPVAEGRPA